MIVDFYISCIPQERLEWLAAILVELSEELYVLKPAGMDESAQYIDRHTEYVTEEADDDQCDRTLEAGTDHRAQQIYNAGDDAGGETECEKSRVGQDIRYPARYSVY